MSNLKYTKEILEPVVRESKTWADVCRKLGVKPMTGSQSNIKNKAVKYGVDFSHFVGSAFNKGRTFPKKHPIEYYLVKDKHVKSDQLKKRLWDEGIKDRKCESCGLEKWLGKDAPLELDHINGDHFDNRLENLQILCPNCHAFKGTKKPKKK